MSTSLRRDFARAAVRAAFSAIAVGAAFGAVAAAQAQAIENVALFNHQAPAPAPVPQNNPFTLFIKTSEILAGGLRDRERVAATGINVQAQNWNAGGDKMTPSRGAPKP